MKTIILVSAILFVHSNLIAQEITVAPLNDDFLEYLNNIKKEELKIITDEGYYLGIIPTPFAFHFSNYSNDQVKDYEIPSSYDLRDVEEGAYLTSVKNQGKSGTCWAFATYGSIESYILKQAKGTFDLSEQNLAVCNGFNSAPDEGGNADKSIAYLSRHSGPVSEEDDPYTEPDENTICESLLPPAIYVEQAFFLPGCRDAMFNPDLVKEAIIENGALYINLRYDSKYYNYRNKTYYYSGTNYVNHAVTLIGWDDNKVVTGGSIATPENPGAWIVKNSWGENWGEEGFFYISYEDRRALSTIVYFPSAVDYNSNVKTYYYDNCGMINSTGFSDESGFALIKYTAEEDEILTKIGTFASSDNTTLNMEVYGAFNGEAPSNYKGGIQNCTCIFPGYHTFPLDTSIKLKKGDEFYIKIQYITSDYYYPIPFEYKIPGYSSYTTIEEAGKCWVSPSGTPSSWMAVGNGTQYIIDLCIKAYTTIDKERPLSSDFDANIYDGTIPLLVSFKDLSEGEPNAWEWDFNGDSIIDSYKQNPEFTYTEPGTFSVTLTVYNDTASQRITKNNFVTILENDPDLNEWIQMEGIKSSRIWNSASFTIKNTGYTGTGNNNIFNLPDYERTFYKYTPSENAWSRIESLPNSACTRINATAFSILNKGYICGGQGAYWKYCSELYLKDLWEYEPEMDSWTQKADFPRGIIGGTGFSIGSKGYVGLGMDDYKMTNSFFVYDPASDKWNQLNDFPGSPRQKAIGFSYKENGYIALGYDFDSDNGYVFYNDIWEYNANDDTWENIATFPGEGRQSTIGYRYQNYIYIGLGNYNDLYRYDLASKEWELLNFFPASPRYSGYSFLLGNTIFYGGGGVFSKYVLSDLWGWTLPYDPTNNNKNDFIIYPNISNGIINFERNVSKIRIYNLSGTCIMNDTETKNSLNINHLPTGYYIINFLSEDGKTFEKKIIKTE